MDKGSNAVTKRRGSASHHAQPEVIRLGYLLFGYGLTRVTPSAATTLTLAEPAIAALLAVVIVGERLPAIGWAGLAGICASLLVLSLVPATQARTPEPSRSSELPIGQEV